MSLWDTISNLAKELTKTPENAPKPAPDAGQRIPSAAYLPDTAPRTSVSTPGVTRSSGFGLYSDIAKNLPANPGGWNDAIEQLRVGGIETVGGTLGVITEATLGRVDEKTDGALTRLLMAGPKNVRSNYAFVRDVENNSTGMGLLAGLGIIGGGALAGAAAVTVGAPVAAVAGLTAIGAASVLTAALLISNTLRIAAFNRRRETGVMKLVGASSFSIQLPFLLEGVFAAVFGWLVSTGFLAGFKAIVDSKVAPLLTFTQFFTWKDVWVASAWLLLTGLLVSGVASVLTLRKYLKV